MSYKKKLEKNIKLFYLFSFFSSLIFTVPVWVAFERRFLSFSQMALLESIMAGTIIFLELPTGALADLLGRRKTITIGSILAGAAVMYTSFTTSFLMILPAFILLGIANALISGADSALAFDTLKELGREDEYSKFRAKSGIIFRTGLIVATLLGGYLYQTWVGLPYFLKGSTQIIATIFVYMMIEPRIDTEKFSLKSYIKQTKDGIKELTKSDYMKKLTVFYTLVGGITWACIYYFSQPFAMDFGFNEKDLSWIFGIIFIVSSILIYLLVSKKGLLTRNRVYLGFPLIIALSLLPGIFAPKSVVPVMLFGITIAGIGRFSILDRYTNKEFLSKYRATAISALNMLISIFFIITVGLAGKVQDAYGTKIIFTLLGIAALTLALPSGLALVKERKRYLTNISQ